MYIRCVQYTYMLHFLNKLILICLFMSFRNIQISYCEKLSLRKYKCWFLIKFTRHKNDLNMLIYVLKLLSQVYVSIHNVKTSFMVFSEKIKDFL